MPALVPPAGRPEHEERVLTSRLDLLLEVMRSRAGSVRLLQVDEGETEEGRDGREEEAREELVMAHIRKLDGGRWQARYRNPDDRREVARNFTRRGPRRIGWTT